MENNECLWSFGKDSILNKFLIKRSNIIKRVFSNKVLSNEKCKIIIKDYKKILDVAISRFNQLFLLENNEFLDDNEKNQIKSLIKPYDKNIEFYIIVEFTNAKWIGSTNNMNIRLSVNTLKNTLEPGDYDPETIISETQKLDLRNLIFLFNNSINVNKIGTKILIEKSNYMLKNGDNIDYFSDYWSLNSLISIILKSESKNLISEKITVVDEVGSLEVFF